MISKDTISKIMDHVRIEEVVGDFVTLKRRGSAFVGLCPFHDEKTPSFTVTPSKNIFKCFGCGKGGDGVNFVMEHEHMTYPEALRFLAERYRIEVEETVQSAESIDQQSARESMLIALKYAADFFTRQLWETETGKAIGYSYFRERGLSDETIKAFALGYAPDSYDAFMNDAKQHGFEREILLKVGLLKEKDGKVYDFFRDRVMFPVHNLAGKVVAFGGRILQKNDKIAKYINTPETELYHKSQTLYGFFQAKNEIRKQDLCYLVEGYMDVIMLYQAGITNVVASSGTSLTTEQIKLIHRFTENIIILYDGDKAGVKAALRGLDMLLEQGMNVKVVLLPENHDPDSYVTEKGAQGMLDYIKTRQQDFIYFKASLSMEEAGKDPVAKVNLIKDIVGSIALINDPIKRMVYIQELARMMQVSESVLVQEVNKIKRAWLKQQQPGEKAQPEADVITPTPAEEQRMYERTVEHQERDIIRVLIEHADKSWEDGEPVAAYLLVHLAEAPFNNPLYRHVIDKAIQLFEAHENMEKLREPNVYDQPEVRKLIAEILSKHYEVSDNWYNRHEIIIVHPEKNYKRDVISSLNRFKLVRVLEHLAVFDEKIRNEKDLDAQMDMLRTRQSLFKERQTLTRDMGNVVLR